MNDRWIRGLLVSTLAILYMPAAEADIVVVTGSNAGAIPDNDPGGRTISFSVTSGHLVGRVAIGLQMTHSWVGDLDATLRSPGGKAQLVVFSRVGAGTTSPNGDSSNLDGAYFFTDPTDGESSPPVDFWTAAASADGGTIIPPGDYRTSTAGMPSLSNHGGCSTRLDAAFGDAIPQSEGVSANGTWTLTVSDNAGGDTGTVSLAQLFILEAENIFASGFDLPTPQVFTNCTKTTHDLTGNGLADYTTLSDNSGSIEWTVLENTGGGTSGAISIFHLGAAGSNSAAWDTYNSADIDGDGIDDAVVFTPATGLFKIRRSSRPGLVPLEVSFGPPLAGETRNPFMVGDYDGDGLDDLAIERQRTAAPFGQSYLEYVRSADGLPVVLAVGDNIGGNFLRNAGGVDFGGDHKADLIQEISGSTDFVVYRGTDGMAAPAFSFGTPVQTLLAANHAGDARADLTATRIIGVDIVWETRTTGTGATSTPLAFGSVNIPGTFLSISAADFDGDGLLDYSYWLRNNAGTGPSQFFVKPTTDLGTTWTVDTGSGSRTYSLPGARIF